MIMNVNCEWVRNYLPLFLYQELSFEEEEALQTHVAVCSECKAALETEKAMHATLDQGDAPLPVGLLHHCRQELAAQLATEQARPAAGLVERARQWFGGFTAAALVLRPVVALGLVAFGFFGARLMPVEQSVEASPFVASVADPLTSRVRRVERAGTGRVQIVLDETRQRIVFGSPEEEPIRQLMISAASDPSDPGLRGEMIEILGSVAPCDQTRQALLQAVVSDTNDGVRLRAMEALKPLAHQGDVRRVLAQVLLKDPNAGVRTKAIDLLTENQDVSRFRGENEMIGVFQDLMGREQNHYIRMQVQRQLQQVKASTEVY